MNIFLCGLPTVGKTRFGQALAQYLSFPFLDTDDLVLRTYAEKKQKSIKHLFQAVGETTFSSWEVDILRSLSLPQSIIALGGGTLLHPEAGPVIKSKGPLVFLSLPLFMILERLKNRGIPERLKHTQNLTCALQKRIDFMYLLVDYCFPMGNVDFSKEQSLLFACESFTKLLRL